MAEGVLLYFFGERIRGFLHTQFNLLSVGLVVLAVAGFWAVHHFGKRAQGEQARATVSEATPEEDES